jgi:FKBP-type peptidyl-prolyl cis-trans isomerase 2
MTNKVAIESGQTVSVHYVGKLDDGTEFDNSRLRGEAISVEVGSGTLIAGFDTALLGMTVGETKSFKINSEDAYGEVNPEAFHTVPHSQFPPGHDFVLDEVVQGQSADGQPVMARISGLGEEEVTLDFNHPLAGKTLNFEIEVLSAE